jgi:outer membrane protein assembly factor BamB
MTRENERSDQETFHGKLLWDTIVPPGPWLRKNAGDKPGDVSATHIRWTGPRIPEAVSSPIIVGPHVYRLIGSGVLKCWRASTGEQVYSERLAGISTTWASPVADGDGRLYFASAGKGCVVQSGPEFRVLAVNDLGDGNHASPAVAKGRLFLVGLKNLYCIGKGK